MTSSLPLLAQDEYVPVESWVTQNSEQDTIPLSRTVTDDRGNVYVIGGTYDLQGGENENFVTTKYDSSGNLLWQREFNGNADSSDQATDIAIDENHNVIVTGFSYSDTTNDKNLITIKYDSSGNKQWINAYNGTGDQDDVPAAVVVDGNDNIYVTGGSFGIGTSYDVVTMRYSPSGTQDWLDRYDNAQLPDVPVTMEEDDGRIYVSGGTSPDTISVDYLDILYRAADGAKRVTTDPGPGIGVSQVSDIAVDHNGDVYVTGSVIGSNGNYDFKTMKMDDSLNVQWKVTYDRELDDKATDVEVDTNGNVYVAGFTTLEYKDYTLVKYDSSGNGQWKRHFDGNAGRDDKPAGLVVEPNGTAYITGTSKGEESKNFVTIKYATNGRKKWERVGSIANTTTSPIASSSSAHSNAKPIQTRPTTFTTPTASTARACSLAATSSLTFSAKSTPPLRTRSTASISPL
ncbi:MAG: hypothetical protein BRD50_09335 [Bacteroidetes bacterium SW_11_45_7]|nr:MAG: hypothetical protein BRD50_09335 [Bacteroidetes bacterium SW_11_45_7]